MLGWNKALWLALQSCMTIFNLSESFISAYAMLKFVFDIDSGSRRCHLFSRNNNRSETWFWCQLNLNSNCQSRRHMRWPFRSVCQFLRDSNLQLCNSLTIDPITFVYFPEQLFPEPCSRVKVVNWWCKCLRRKIMKKYLAVEHVKWLSSLVSITVHTVSCITSLILKENIVLGSTIALYLDTPMTTILQPWALYYVLSWCNAELRWPSWLFYII